MALSPVLPSVSTSQLIYVKTNIGGWFFDAFLRVEHTSKLKITEHPVQTGANVADHAYLESQQLAIEVGMTDVVQSIVNGQFSQGWSRSVTAYKVLRQLQASRIPVQVNTRLGIYKNMLVETITTPDTYETQYGLRATVTLKELIVAQVTTVKVSKRPQVTGSTQRGNPEPVKPNQSILRQWFSGMGIDSYPDSNNTNNSSGGGGAW